MIVMCQGVGDSGESLTLEMARLSVVESCDYFRMVLVKVRVAGFRDGVFVFGIRI